MTKKESSSVVGAFSGKTDNILVVDSDRSEAAKLSVMIGNMSPNYVVRYACSGSEAVEKSAKGSACVVVVAETLSDMSAHTFFDIIKCVQKKTTCILLAEEQGLLADKQTQTDASFRIIKKPYKGSELAYNLDRAFDHDGLNGKLVFNTKLAKFFCSLIPVAVVVGMVARLLGK